MVESTGCGFAAGISFAVSALDTLVAFSTRLAVCDAKRPVGSAVAG